MEEESPDALKYHDPVGSEESGAMGQGKPLLLSLHCSVPLTPLDRLVSLGPAPKALLMTETAAETIGGGLGALPSSSSKIQALHCLLPCP